MRPVESSAAVRRDLRPIKCHEAIITPVLHCKHRDLMIAIGYRLFRLQIRALVPSMEALVAWSIHNAVSDLVVFGKRGNLMALQIQLRFCNPEV